MRMFLSSDSLWFKIQKYLRLRMSMGLLGCASIDNTKLICQRKKLSMWSMKYLCRWSMFSRFRRWHCLRCQRHFFKETQVLWVYRGAVVWWENSNILGLVWCYVESISDHKRELLEVDFHEIVNHSVCDSDC